LIIHISFPARRAFLVAGLAECPEIIGIEPGAASAKSNLMVDFTRGSINVALLNAILAKRVIMKVKVLRIFPILVVPAFGR
jgi:hypothetical protein